MKQNKLHKTGFVLIALLTLLLSGFSRADKTEFPAPFAEPMLCFYADFTLSGLYGSPSEAENAARQITDYVCQISALRGDRPNDLQLKAAADNIISNTILSGVIKPDSLLFYLNTPKEFLILLNGTFSPEKIAALAGRQYEKQSGSALYYQLKSPFDPDEELSVLVRADKIIICNESIFELMSDHIEFNNNLLNSDFATFKTLLSLKPALALEADAEKISAQFGKLPIIGFDGSAAHVRLVSASNVNRLQFFVPDEEKRNKMALAAEDEAAGINELTAFKYQLSSKNKGTSIFVDAAANEELAASASKAAYGALLHFFAPYENSTGRIAQNSVQ